MVAVKHNNSILVISLFNMVATFNHFYWPTNALNCIKLKGINVLKDN